ncbi:phytoene/squalene synthase family protein [Archangium violaceum]|uniref:phytoene/squalene synthase family protein n=1 Tax=Archangium violaceum TaxID=83451 RepID=UPI0019527A4B|nr:phytoene/squalene synthase family protein [Archangium violaceum]QRN97406.1 phytoene/squalene synthase family protein [Archangium violaceum]
MSPRNEPDAVSFCREVLPAVSRTFALNIPVLPGPLDTAVMVAYLLCRIADTLEDEAHGPASAALLTELARLSTLPEGWQADAKRFTQEALRVLRAQTPAAELRLLEGTPRVLEALAVHEAPVRGHVAACVATMTEGMGRMGDKGRVSGGGLGLESLEETMRYCYYVAGTVGEMLTRLFTWYSPAVAERAEKLEPRAVAFGNALQLVNILKDVREDLERGSCWLPRTVLAEYGLTPESLLQPDKRDEAMKAHGKLVAVAHRELRQAFEYVMALPREEHGIRLFCLWPLFLAVMTLRKVYGNKAVLEKQPVKISRRTVKWVLGSTKLLVARDSVLKMMFAALTAPLPA